MRLWRRSARFGCGITVLAASILGSSLTARHAFAIIACRADPVVILSNGLQLDLHVTFNDGSASDVQQVSYVLDGPPLPANADMPAGAVMVGDGWYAYSYPDGSDSYSSMSYVPDAASNNYFAHVMVTASQQIPVAFYMDWLSSDGRPTPTNPARGYTGQTLTTHMYVLDTPTSNGPAANATSIGGAR